MLKYGKEILASSRLGDGGEKKKHGATQATKTRISWLMNCHVYILLMQDLPCSAMARGVLLEVLAIWPQLHLIGESQIHKLH